MSKIKLDLNVHTAVVEINGQNVARNVTGLTLSSAPGESPKLALTMIVTDGTQVEIDDASVRVVGIEVSERVARDLYDRLRGRFT